MAITFDHANKLIKITAPTTTLTMQDLINSIRTEEASSRGMVYDQIADASGKEDLGGGVFTGITVSLLSTWKIEWYAGNYTARIDGGNLSDAISKLATVMGGPQIAINSSAASTIVDSGGGGNTPEQIADSVWAHSFVAKLLTVAKFLGLK